MKIVITALISTVIGIITWESLHVVYHIDEPAPQVIQKNK